MSAPDYVVFLSYPAQQAVEGSTIAQRLEVLGARVWRDQRKPKQDFEALLKPINACDEAVVLLSPKPATSELVEIGVLLGRQKRVTVLEGPGSQAGSDLPGVEAIPLGRVDDFLKEVAHRVATPSDKKRKKAIDALRGSLSVEDADQLRDEAARLRARWR